MKTNKKMSSNGMAQCCLKQEIIEFEKRLQNQFDVRRDLEKASGCRTSSHGDNTHEISTPKPASTELIKEIAVLELEVSHLEQYLLSLYRKAFEQQISSSKQQSLSSPTSTLTQKPPSRCFSFDSRLRDPMCVEKEIDSGVRRCQSSLNHRSAFNDRICPPQESLHVCHSQPWSVKGYMQTGSNLISLAEHLGVQISDHVPMTPNKLSEEMIKCATEVYCKLAHPPLINHGLSYPSLSEQYDMWSPSFIKRSSFVRLDNPLHMEGLKEFSGPNSSMVEVSCIHRHRKKGRELELMLRNFSSLIGQLEGIDPTKLAHQEKLAFWINVHNALVMHTFLAHGVPQNNGNRFLLLSKPTYNIGGRMISVETIQISILRCRMSRPGQWLRLLLTPRKLRTGEELQDYSLGQPEPLLYFALCSGSHSDPAVRVYTAKRILEELETAKEEYIRGRFGVRKDEKIVLPKVVELFTKDSGLSQTVLMEMIQDCLPDRLKKFHTGKPRKSIIEWMPHNFGFRYLIRREHR